MMAREVTIHYIDDENWEKYAVYVYDRSNNNEVTGKWPGQVAKATDIKVVDGNKKEVTWKIDLKSCELKNARVIFNNNNNGKQYPTSQGWDVVDGASYNKNGKITSSGGGSGTETGGGGGSTTVDWNTVTTNRLTENKRVYTQGFYLAGNFFTFDTLGINYDDAVFKFQQQKDQSINTIAETPYDVYMVEIPASLTAHAQVMYVDADGNKTGIFGPGTANIDKGTPATGKSTEWADITANGSASLFDNTQNYWNFSTRNESKSEYSDGLYEVYIAVDKETHKPAKWMITHQAFKRVAYFISDAPDATAMPLYDTYKGFNNEDNKQFSNKFFATVNLAANRSYYVISNYIRDKQYEEWAKSYGAFNPNKHAISCPTTNKLFLLGNGGLEYTGSDPENEVLPNEAPVKIKKNNLGTQIVEYNPSKGDEKRCLDNKHYGFIGEIQLRTDRVVLTSVSLVGDAIPGTINADSTWNYKSNVADMTYDETEQCYKATVVTTVPDDGKSKFRFVGNRDQKITWYENTNTDEEKMAKHPYNSSDASAKGHTADANDPNEVNYTQYGANPEEDWNIIWNRPAGRWTVRLYFYTYSDGNNPKTKYYYTITESKDMVLHDVTDIVYGSEDNKQIITNNLDDYKFMRTWSAKKSWKISDKVDIFVVSDITDDKSGVKMTLTNINNFVSPTERVIPANTGVILATKSDASEISGSHFKSRQDFTSYNNLVIPMELNDSDVVYNGTNKLEPILVSRVIPSSDKDKYNYLFGYYNTQIATGDKKHDANEYLLGFWISKGSKPYSSNSSYLPIDKATAAKMKYLGTSYKDYVTGGNSAKKIPALLFDFANVGGTTGINEVVNQSTKLNDGKYYTLSGQQVEKPTAGGIYIHNGRKFVVK